MKLRGVIQYKRQPRGLMKAFRPILKEELKFLVKFWHRTFMPQHFTLRGKVLYGYQPRTAKYERRKARLHGHRKPLVFTGQSERQARQFVRVTGTSKKATATMKMPKHFYRYHKDTQVNKEDELTRTNPRELDAQAKLLKKRTARRMNQIRTPQTVRV